MLVLTIIAPSDLQDGSKYEINPINVITGFEVLEVNSQIRIYIELFLISEYFLDNTIISWFIYHHKYTKRCLIHLW